MSRRQTRGFRQKRTSQLFQTSMCKFNQQGKCEDGCACSQTRSPQEMGHDPDLTCASVCEILVREGLCVDADCQSAHGGAQLRAASRLSRMKMCRFGSRCRNGDSCRFAHSTEELRSANQGHGNVQRGQGRQGVAADQDSSGSCPRARSSDAPYAERQDSDSAEDSAEGSSQGAPHSDHTSGRSSTADLTSDSWSGAAGAIEDGAGSGCNGSGVAEATTGASSREQAPRLKRKKRGSEKPGQKRKAAGPCTLVISNIPANLTQRSLLALFEDLTPTMRGTFDFFYCPWDQEATRNFDHATINFTNGLSALSFQQQWSNKQLCHTGRKHIRITKASLQGLEANLACFSKNVTTRMEPRFRPLFRDGSGLLSSLTLADDPDVDLSAAPLQP